MPYCFRSFVLMNSDRSHFTVGKDHSSVEINMNAVLVGLRIGWNRNCRITRWLKTRLSLDVDFQHQDNAILSDKMSRE
jgi:hypothetical protein